MATCTRRVVIIGAGIAGVSAAAELSRSGLCEVTILEAMKTPGGRIQTVKGFASNALELGAYWLHGTKGNPVYHLAVKHNLLAEDSSKSSDEDMPGARWFSDGDDPESKYLTEDGQLINHMVVSKAKKIYTSVQRASLLRDPYTIDASVSLGDFMRKGFAQELKRGGIKDPEDLRQYWLIFEHCCRMECIDIGCDSLRDIQLRSHVFYEGLAGDYYTVPGQEGYQAILEKLLQDVPAANIHYSTPVKRIEYSSGNIANDIQDVPEGAVRVQCEDGRTFLCDHVIVTSSVGYLQENVETFFDPPLPSEMQEALMKFQYGTVNKIFLKYKKPFWSSDEFRVQTVWQPALGHVDEAEDRKKFYRMFTSIEAEERNMDVLVAWTYGQGAKYMETLSDQEVGQCCARILRQFLNDPSIPDPDSVLCTRWHSNKYQRGAYFASLALNSTGVEFDIMKTPVYGNTRKEGGKVPVLLFAGEAYHRAHYSTTHGAMLCGRDQANVLCEFISSQKPQADCVR